MRRHRLVLVNETHYETRDLRRFFVAGINALTHGEWSSKHVTVVYSRRWAHWRGGVWACAELGGTYPGHVMRFAVPKDPANWTVGDLARVLRHEHAHNLGIRHGDMDAELRYCQGPDPEWCAGLRVDVRRPRARPPVDLRARRHASVLEGIARWERALRTAERRLRKLRRQDAYYRRALVAASTGASAAVDPAAEALATVATEEQP